MKGVREGNTKMEGREKKRGEIVTKFRKGERERDKKRVIGVHRGTWGEREREGGK